MCQDLSPCASPQFLRLLLHENASTLLSKVLESITYVICSKSLPTRSSLRLRYRQPAFSFHNIGPVPRFPISVDAAPMIRGCPAFLELEFVETPRSGAGPAPRLLEFVEMPARIGQSVLWLRLWATSFVLNRIWSLINKNTVQTLRFVRCVRKSPRMGRFGIPEIGAVRREAIFGSNPRFRFDARLASERYARTMGPA